MHEWAEIGVSLEGTASYEKAQKSVNYILPKRFMNNQIFYKIHKIPAKFSKALILWPYLSTVSLIFIF